MREHIRQSLKTGHVICIFEGTAEEVVTKLLFNDDRLIFKKKDQLIRDFSRTRKGEKFAQEHLQRDYGEEHINIVRIVDSSTERFNLGKVYEERVKESNIRIFNIVTRPEIEMLFIISEDNYASFKNKASGQKPSTYCRSVLNMKELKREKFVYNYFNDLEKLIASIKDYKKLHGTRNEYCLYDLLDEN